MMGDKRRLGQDDSETGKLDSKLDNKIYKPDVRVAENYEIKY